MEKFIKISLCVLFCFLIPGCFKEQGSGKLITKERTVSSFTGVKLTGSVDVHVFQADMRSVEVKTDDNMINYITTEVRDGVLDIGMLPGKPVSPTHLEIFVVNPTYESIESAGAGNIWSMGSLYGDTLRVRLSGTGDMTLLVEAKEIDALLSGSGSMTVKGYAPLLKAQLSGTGDLSAIECTAKKAAVTLSGSGECSVFARDELKIDLRGSGNVLYRGNPVIDSSVSGSGVIVNTHNR
jgi:hypothetical protein